MAFSYIYIVRVKSMDLPLMTMAAAMAAAPATLRGFPVLLIPHHASDHQRHDASQNRQHNDCTHLYYLLLKILFPHFCTYPSKQFYAAFFFVVFNSSVLLSL